MINQCLHLHFFVEYPRHGRGNRILNGDFWEMLLQVRLSNAWLTHADLILMEDQLPKLPNQERIVLVETWSTYEPLFNIGMEDVEIKTFVFTRLRFAPQLRYCSTCS